MPSLRTAAVGAVVALGAAATALVLVDRGGVPRILDTSGCTAEVERAREIVKRGTSAHRQIEIFQAALADGADEDEALRRVVDWLAEETMVGVAS